MSIRSNGTGDHLAVNASLGITTGAYSMGCWAKLISDRNTYSDLFSIQTDESGPTSYVTVSTLVDGTGGQLYDNISGSGDISPGFSFTVGTWYWIVVTRSGTTTTIAIFDDSTSTTPVGSGNAGSASGSLTTLDWLIVGQTVSGEWADAEYANIKVHVGVAWTNAQARTESQHSAKQTGGGTWYAACSLQSLAAGLTDSSGAGHNLTNTGCVDGASNPAQLTYDSGGDTGTETAFRRLVAVKGSP